MVTGLLLVMTIAVLIGLVTCYSVGVPVRWRKIEEEIERPEPTRFLADELTGTSPRRILEEIGKEVPGRHALVYDGDNVLALWTSNAGERTVGVGLNTRAACVDLAKKLNVNAEIV